jgi:hypothetical protein
VEIKWNSSRGRGNIVVHYLMVLGITGGVVLKLFHLYH